MEVDGTGAIEAATADIPQPWREAQTSHIEEGKEDFRGPGRVSRMLQNRQLCFIAQDGIEDIGRIPCRDDHGFGAVL